MIRFTRKPKAATLRRNSENQRTRWCQLPGDVILKVLAAGGRRKSLLMASKSLEMPLTPQQIASCFLAETTFDGAEPPSYGMSMDRAIKGGLDHVFKCLLDEVSDEDDIQDVFEECCKKPALLRMVLDNALFRDMDRETKIGYLQTTIRSRRFDATRMMLQWSHAPAPFGWLQFDPAATDADRAQFWSDHRDIVYEAETNAAIAIMNAHAGAYTAFGWHVIRLPVDFLDPNIWDAGKWTAYLPQATIEADLYIAKLRQQAEPSAASIDAAELVRTLLAVSAGTRTPAI